MGGINWVDVSGMVFSSFIGYQRYSIYERWPWEGNAISFDRASNYYEFGNISRDMRFGMQPFKGLLIDGAELQEMFGLGFYTEIHLRRPLLPMEFLLILWEGK